MFPIYNIQLLRTLSNGYFKKPSYRKDLETRVPCWTMFPNLRDQETWFVIRVNMRTPHIIKMLQGGRVSSRPAKPRRYAVMVPRTTSTKYVVASIAWHDGTITEHDAYQTKREALSAAKIASLR